MKFYLFIIIFFILMLQVNAWNSVTHKALATKAYYNLDFDIQDKLNLSYITEKFNLINIKIDAVDGKLLKETTAPLLSFKKDN